MTIVSFFVLIASFTLTPTGIVYCCLSGLVLAFFLISYMDKREQDIISIGSDIKNYRNLFQIELYVVKMLHELEKFSQNDEYG
jgi:hypothetical protein